MKRIAIVLTALVLISFAGIALAADIVPTDVQQPGTQPNEVGNLESPDKCDNCHGGYNSSVEPAFNWRGSMMANAGRDPIFWATLAIAEQDFDGSGDLCLRCHSTAGWMAGHSTPTDGSGLVAGDADGVDCDTCHKMTNPDNSEHLGVMNEPFVANDGITGYSGSGILSLWGGADKLGPFSDADARHQFMQSEFHRSKDFCGSCHDVSNPVVGNLAPNHGTQPTGDPVVADNTLGGSVDGKAAFNNFPYQYGIVERTYSEFYSGLLSQTLVSDFSSLPADLQNGAVQAAYESAGGNYEDGTERYFTCQTCHMRAVTGEGANKRGVPTRTDLPLHDMTGGNYWMPEAILYQDSMGTLRLGGGLSSVQVDALYAGEDRALQQLNLAAALDVSGNTLKVTNLTGHKLISGYPEGRRMWLNIKWYDTNNTLLREDGAYGDLDVNINGSTATIRTLTNLEDPNTKIYDAHYGMTQEWAAQLVDLGYETTIPLSFDRVTGDVAYTLGDLAAQAPDTAQETFHFVINNTVIKDNRIPPYGFDYEEARKRNALPVPADQYGGSLGGTYEYWDEVALNLPANATYAEINLMYQPTSWEYVQFLYLANEQGNAFLGQEGVNMLDAWLHTGMAEPYTMATATWGNPSGTTCTAPIPELLSTTSGNQKVLVEWSDIHATDPGVTGYHVYYDQAGKAQSITSIGLTTSYTDTNLTNGQEYCYKVTTLYEVDGTSCESSYSNIICETPTNQGQAEVSIGVTQLETGKLTGKGNNKTFILTDTFTQGDTVIVRAYVIDGDTGLPVSNATVEFSITGPENTTITSNPSDNTGMAEASWATSAPNRKGNGGTTPGTYTVTVTNVIASGYLWDGVATSTSITLE